MANRNELTRAVDAVQGVASEWHAQVPQGNYSGGIKVTQHDKAKIAVTPRGTVTEIPGTADVSRVSRITWRDGLRRTNTATVIGKELSVTRRGEEQDLSPSVLRRVSTAARRLVPPSGIGAPRR